MIKLKIWMGGCQTLFDQKSSTEPLSIKVRYHKRPAKLNFALATLSLSWSNAMDFQKISPSQVSNFFRTTAYSAIKLTTIVPLSVLKKCCIFLKYGCLGRYNFLLLFRNMKSADLPEMFH
jgi:hypothetical protein